MLLDSINMNYLRIFEAVYRTGSMTKAAGELHMTQSGVSQHIKHLEGLLEVTLFDRIKQKLVPTPKSTCLYEKVAGGLEQLEGGLQKITNSEDTLSGIVTIGIPIEFGNIMLVPRLAHFGIKNPGVNYKIVYGFAAEMNELLLKGEIDFAFIDEFNVDPVIHQEEVYRESLILFCSHKYIETRDVLNPTKKDFEKLDYIAYQSDAPLVKMWFMQQLQFSSMDLNVRSSMMDVEGVARMVVAGLGVGIIPEDRLNIIRKNQDVFIFKGTGKRVVNRISLASVKERTFTSAAIRLRGELIDYFNAIS